MVLTKQSLPDQPSLKALILKRGCEARSGTGEFEIFPSITFIKTLEGIPTTTTTLKNSEHCIIVEQVESFISGLPEELLGKYKNIFVILKLF